MQAEHDGLALLTTEKDRARMAGEPLLAALAARAHVLPVTLRGGRGGRDCGRWCWRRCGDSYFAACGRRRCITACGEA